MQRSPEGERQLRRWGLRWRWALRGMLGRRRLWFGQSVLRRRQQVQAVRLRLRPRLRACGYLSNERMSVRRDVQAGCSRGRSGMRGQPDLHRGDLRRVHQEFRLCVGRVLQLEQQLRGCNVRNAKVHAGCRDRMHDCWRGRRAMRGTGLLRRVLQQHDSLRGASRTTRRMHVRMPVDLQQRRGVSQWHAVRRQRLLHLVEAHLQPAKARSASCSWRRRSTRLVPRPLILSDLRQD